MKARENTLRAILRDAPEWVPNGLENVVMVSSPVVERPKGEGYDDFGVHWSLEEEAEGGTYPTLGRHPIADLEDWCERLTVPDIDALDWDGVRAAVAEVDREEFLVRGFVEMGLFERSYLLLGMEGALIGYIEEPELMEELLGAGADYIAGPSHGVPYDQELIDAMNDEIHRYGREVYRG